MVDCWALLCQSHEREFQLEEPSDLLSDSRLTLPCPDNFLSSLLFFSSQSSFFFSFSRSLAPSLFQLNNGIKYPSRASCNAAFIFREHVSVSRYRSTCGVNLAQRSGAILLCVGEYEMLLSEGRSGETWYITVEACGPQMEISEMLQSSSSLWS